MHIDKSSYKLLRLLNEYQVITTLDLEKLFPNQNVTLSQYYLASLIDKGLVAFTTIGDDITVYSRGAMYSITPDGTAYIENRKSEKVKFLISSVVIPMLVAFITSLTTVIVAMKL